VSQALHDDDDAPHKKEKRVENFSLLLDLSLLCTSLCYLLSLSLFALSPSQMLGRAMASTDAARIASALSDVASRVAAAAASASSASSASAIAPRLPRLVAVSKTKPVEALQAAYDAGHRDFGENYVQVQGTKNVEKGRSLVFNGSIFNSSRPQNLLFFKNST